MFPPLVNVQLTRDGVLAVRYHRPCWPALMKPDEKARLMPINISVRRYKRGPLARGVSRSLLYAGNYVRNMRIDSAVIRFPRRRGARQPFRPGSTASRDGTRREEFQAIKQTRDSELELPVRTTGFESLVSELLIPQRVAHREISVYGETAMELR